jgi:type IV secretion system protein VirB2
MAVAPTAHASAAGMPWEAPLETIVNSITGPVAQGIAVLAIAACGLTLAFGNVGGAGRWLVGIVFGISIAFAAATFGASLFGTVGGAVLPMPVVEVSP